MMESSKKIKILVLLAEPWRNDDGGGNTLNNFFEGMNAEFAQVYCSSKMPDNTTCNLYYQMSDGEVIRKFFLHKPIGRKFEYNGKEQNKAIQNDGEVFVKKIKKHRLNLFLTAKMFLWRFSNWKTEGLKKFVLDFNPDVIFAPCYAFPFQCALTRWVKKITGKKIVSYSGDDTYSLRQFSFSPFFWINRIWARNAIKKTFKYYDAFYSMSEDEIEYLEPILKKKIKIIRKSVPDGLVFTERQVHTPIRIIYAGGVYIQRWKVLKKIGDALKKINVDSVKCVLDIYTQNELNEKQKKALDDGKNIICHRSISKEELIEEYSKSDIALHVESQSLHNKLITRFSFSTKIIDCLASGCAVMAIAWKEQTGLKYLSKNEAAICITDEKKIEGALRTVIDNSETIKRYAKNAFELAIKNHKKSDLQKDLYECFLRLADFNK